MWIILSFTGNDETANHKTIAAFNSAYEKPNKRKVINVAKHAQSREVSLRLMRQEPVISLMAQGKALEWNTNTRHSFDTHGLRTLRERADAVC